MDPIRERVIARDRERSRRLRAELAALMASQRLILDPAQFERNLERQVKIADELDRLTYGL